MAACENFNCKFTCSRKSDTCNYTCIFALYIHKCSSCRNRDECQGSELYQKAMQEKKEEMAKWIKKEPG